MPTQTVRTLAGIEPSDTGGIYRSALGKVRFFVGYAVIAILTAFYGVGYIVEARVRPRSTTFQRWAGAWARAILNVIGMRLETTGATDLRSLQPCVFVANHQTAADIPILLSALPVPFGFVAKADLEHVPILGAVLRTSPCVFVDDTNPRRSLESLERAASAIRSGNSVAIFPEGRRTWSDTVAVFKKSAFALAAEAGVPIVVVTIVDADKLLDERSRFSRPGVVRVACGPVLRASDESRSAVQDLSREARDIIQTRMDELRG